MSGIIEKGEQLAAKPGGGVRIVHTYPQYKRTGKYYIEFEIVQYTGNSDGVGFMTHDATAADVQSTGTNCSVLYMYGAIWSNDANTGLTLGQRTNGDFIGVAIDLDNMKAWFRVSPSGLWNGQPINLHNPVGTVGGVSISKYLNIYMMPVIAYASFTRPITIMNLGERPFSGTVPAGYTPGWPLDPNPPTIWATFKGGQNNKIILSDANVGIAPATDMYYDGLAVASTAWKNHGKHYFEVQRKDGGWWSDGCGLAIEGFTISNITVGQAQGFAIQINCCGLVEWNGGRVNMWGYYGSVMDLGSWAVDEWLCFAVDLDNFRFWVRRGPTGPWLNGWSVDPALASDPATNLNGMDISHVSQTRVTIMGAFTAWNAGKFIFNTGDSAFVGAVPAGFAPGWATGSHTARGNTEWTYWSALTGTPEGYNFIELGDRLVMRLMGGTVIPYVGVRIPFNDFKPHGSGKFYFELHAVGASSTYDAYGLVTRNATDAQMRSITSGIYICHDYGRGGAIFVNGVDTGKDVGQPVGNKVKILGIALDRINRKVWYRMSGGGLWNNSPTDDPANNVGGIDITVFDGQPLGIWCIAGNTWDGFRVLLNSGGGAPFASPVPIGFTPGWPRNTPDTTLPTITSASAVSIGENAALVHALTASEYIASWTIIGGADAAHFQIVAAQSAGSQPTLQWADGTPKDFENPTDANGDNSYIVTIRATDESGNIATQTITVTVIDVDELVALTFAEGTLTNIALSSGDLVVAQSASQVAIAIASAGWKNSGKYYFEVTTVDWGSGEFIGIVPENPDVNKIVTSSFNMSSADVETTSNGEMNLRGADFYTGANLGDLTATGQMICFAIDLDNWRFFARKGATGNWNNNALADPVTGVGGILISHYSQTRVAPFVAFWNFSYSAGAKYGFNFGPTYTATAPTGFTAWPKGQHASIGHPTYASLTTFMVTGGAQSFIEGGNRLASAYGATKNAAHVGFADFKTSGKWYVEFQLAYPNPGWDNSFGFMAYDADPIALQAGVGGAVFFSASGQIWSNDANTGRTLGARAKEDVIGAAIDFLNNKVWFRVSPTGLWNGQAIGLQDPANNVGGVSISNYAGKQMGPFIGFPSPIYAASAINFGQQPFSGTAPATFTSGWTHGGTDTTPATITSASAITNYEDTALLHTLTASEAVTWTISGGADATKFEIVSGNRLRWMLDGTHDFEAPNDADGNNVYVVIVRATDYATPANTADQTINVTVAKIPDTAPPVITSPMTIDNVENTVLAHSLTANESVTWSIVGGADAARFELSGSTLRWLSNGVKDRESPNDADANNMYVVTVRATDAVSNTSNQTITVTVLSDVPLVSLPVLSASRSTNLSAVVISDGTTTPIIPGIGAVK